MVSTNTTSSLKSASPQIALRIRPSILASSPSTESSSAKTKTVAVAAATGADLTKSFDRVFGTSNTQEQVFRATASSLVDRLLQGRNATVLVYGHPQSGKTYTLGASLEGPKEQKDEGLIPRAAHHVFEKLLVKTNSTSTSTSSGSTGARALSNLRPTSARLRPVSFMSSPQRRGSTPSLPASQTNPPVVPAIPGSSNSKAPRYSVQVAYEKATGPNSIHLVDPVTVRNTGDVLRHVEKGASINTTGSSTRFTLSLTTEKWVAKSAPKRRINVRAMVGQMEKRNQDDEDNGEWIKTKARIDFIELHHHQPLPSKWISVLKSDIDLAVLLCLEQDALQADAWMKHAHSLRMIPIDRWLDEQPVSESEHQHQQQSVGALAAAATAVISPSPSTASSSSSSSSGSDEDEDDDMCRPSSSARTTLTIPDDDTTVVADLKRQVEELINQVAVTQERNKHVEAQLNQKNALGKERDAAVAQYLSAIERHSTDNIRVASLVRQLKTCILTPDDQATVFVNPLQEDLDEVLAQLDKARTDHNEAKAIHAKALETVTAELDKARKDHGLARAEHAKVLEEAAAEREQARREIKTMTRALEQARADKDLLEFQLEQIQEVSDDLQTELTQTQKAKACLETELVNTRTAKDAIATELVGAIDAKDKLEVTLKDTQAQMVDDRRRLESAVEEKTVELESVRCVLEAERDALRATVDGITVELEAAQAQARECAKELQTFQALATTRITETEEQLRTFQKLEHAQTAVISRLTDKMATQAQLTETMTMQLETQDACMAVLEKGKDEAEASVERLERELARLSQDRASLQRLIEYVDKALCRNTEQTDQLNEQLVVDIKPHLEAIEQERLELLQKLDEQTKQIELYHVDESEIRTIIVGLESRLQSLHQAQAVDQSDIEKARQREAEAVKTAESLIDKIAQLVQENAQLQSQINIVSPRSSLVSLPPPTAPPSNPLPPVPTSLPPLPGNPTVGVRPQSPPPPPRSTSLLQRQNSNNTVVTGSIATADIDDATTPEKYERIIQGLQRKMNHAETDVRAHQDVISKLESQLSRYENMVREIKRQVDILSREKQASNLEIQNLRTQVSSHQEATRQLEDYKNLTEQLSKERQLKEKAERAKMILESRMEELMSQRKSKFMCF